MFLCPASVSRVLFGRTLGMGAGLVVWERPQEDVAFSDSPTENRGGTVAVRNMRESDGWTRGTGATVIL